MKSNNKLNSLFEEKLRKEKEWKNLVINTTKKIELKPEINEEKKENKKVKEIKENKEEIIDENKNIIIVKEFDNLGIESFSIFIGEEGKPQKIINNNIESELIIKKETKDQKEQEKDKQKSNEDISSKEEHSELLRSVYKKQLPKKDKSKNIKEKETEQIEIIEDNKKQDKIEEVLSEKKQLYTELQPDIQTNIRFSYHLKHKEEEKPENISREPKIEATSISKNDKVNIKGKEEREIKISTKKVIRKNIIQNKFKNIESLSENNFYIHGKKKTKPILEQESQENNRFTLERINVKEEKESQTSDNIINIDNCIQFNLDRLYENSLSLAQGDKNKDIQVKENQNESNEENRKDLQKGKDEKINEEISSKPREIISLISKNDEFSIEKTSPKTTEIMFKYISYI